ncbi:MAG TPA: diacylglycerol kinase family protein [Candidatus Limnocylindrales bacterium]|nr:diacylglycerol kinase family protein [Candidatus Limnocylindrales bacterium]
MPGVGVILNPHASGNRRRAGASERISAIVGEDGEVVVTQDLSALDSALQGFHDRDFDVVAVSGGDGSMCFVVSRAMSIWGADRLPMFVALRGGTINNISRSVGGPSRPEAMMAAVMAGYRRGRAFRIVERPLLCVNGQVYGSIVGAGLITHFLDKYYAARKPSPATAAALLVRCGISWLARTDFIHDVVPRIPGRARCDETPLPFKEFTLILASSATHIGLGVRPFYLSGRKHGYFHLLAGNPTPGQLLSRLGHFWRGFPCGLDTLYDSMARYVRVEFETPQGFTVDGELLPPVTVLEIESGPTARFISGMVPMAAFASARANADVGLQ